MKSIVKIVSLIALYLVLVSQTHATLPEALVAYRSGDYATAIKKIKEVQKENATNATLHYWLGVIYNRVQEFELAKDELTKALELKFDARDLYYELAQALYALDKIDLARKSFLISTKKGYMRGQSLYYAAYISQLKNEIPPAISYYQQLYNLPFEERKDVFQAAMLQLGELYYTQALKHPSTQKMVERYVLPQLELAYRLDSKSQLAAEIEDRIYQIKIDHGISSTKMRNGRPIPRQKWENKVYAEITYDSNVVYEADDAIEKAQNKSSMISKFDLLSTYRETLGNSVWVIPGINLNGSYYSNRDESGVYQNDGFEIQPSLRTSFEHTVGAEMAALSLDLDYVHAQKDVYADGTVRTDSNDYSISLGEQLKFLPQGPTTFKLRYKSSNSYDPTLDSQTTGFSFDQNFSFSSGNMFIFIAALDMTKYSQSPEQDSRSLSMVGSYIMPRWGTRFVLPTFSLAYTMTDPQEQKEERGYEHSFTPEFHLSYMFTPSLKLRWAVNYTKKISKDEESYAYQKWTTGFRLIHAF